ncbi:hypothetical protein HMPREF1162_1710 [ [[Propionibacterium] namnetense SK182B-JCVI]|uniref:Uncharacterized protein n=1 Tax=[Propionibacterium] namnetense SK182B-JCVI TaxID=1051006 RepID=F9NVX9_9ACTN|nr:hypothetical protein HMPREF1162_1710 [ [[Propionibacterium] namnetense SK182B-JCVI]
MSHYLDCASLRANAIRGAVSWRGMGFVRTGVRRYTMVE